MGTLKEQLIKYRFIEGDINQETLAGMIGLVFSTYARMEESNGKMNLTTQRAIIKYFQLPEVAATPHGKAVLVALVEHVGFDSEVLKTSFAEWRLLSRELPTVGVPLFVSHIFKGKPNVIKAWYKGEDWIIQASGETVPNSFLCVYAWMYENYATPNAFTFPDEPPQPPPKQEASE